MDSTLKEGSRETLAARSRLFSNRSFRDFGTATSNVALNMRKVHLLNEIDPHTHEQLKIASDSAAEAILAKREATDICCEELDKEQLSILRDERVARTYLNTSSVFPLKRPKLQRWPSNKFRMEVAEEERKNKFMKNEDNMEKIFKAYGIPYKKKKYVPQMKLTPKEKHFCDRVKETAAFKGPAAMNIRPVEVLKGPQKSKFYQITPEDMAAYKLPNQTARVIKKYTTTPRAVWMENRFKYPGGIDYKEIQEQIKTARYKAMVAALSGDSNHKNTGIAKTRLWSAYDPSIQILSAREIESEAGDEEQEQEQTNYDWGQKNKPLPEILVENSQEDKVIEENDTELPEELKEMQKRESGSNLTIKRRAKLDKKSVFKVNEKYFEDLKANAEKARKQVIDVFSIRPYGTYFTHPKDTAKYKNICLKAARAEKLFIDITSGHTTPRKIGSKTPTKILELKKEEEEEHKDEGGTEKKEEGNDEEEGNEEGNEEEGDEGEKVIGGNDDAENAEEDETK